MEISLTKDETIFLYLKYFIPIPELCYKIIKIKNESESAETYNYHLDRWIKIAGEHYYTRDNHYGKFSYVLGPHEYIIKADHRLNFYQMTGISYQVLELIYELIKINDEKSWDFEIDDKKEWLKYDDKLYSKLSRKIMIEMKNKK
tara:strand:+ start:69 stop:503 length:435 start_codon:yes stop_codon:yes gene_type:complete